MDGQILEGGGGREGGREGWGEGGGGGGGEGGRERMARDSSIKG